MFNTDFAGCTHLVSISLPRPVYGERLNQALVSGISLSCRVKETSCDKDHEEMLYIHVVNEGGVHHLSLVASSAHHPHTHSGVYL